MPAPFDPECLFRALAERGVDYVLIGGLAAVLHGSTAITNDADIAPDPGQENLDRLAGALRHLEARLRTASSPDGVPFEPHPALLASMAMLHLTTKCGDLDVAFSSAGLDDYAALAARSIEMELTGSSVRVAALRDIIRSKEAAGRPKDHAMLPILRALEEEVRRQDR